MSCPLAYSRREITSSKSVIFSFFADIFEIKIDTAKIEICYLFYFHKKRVFIHFSSSDHRTSSYFN